MNSTTSGPNPAARHPRHTPEPSHGSLHAAWPNHDAAYTTTETAQQRISHYRLDVARCDPQSSQVRSIPFSCNTHITDDSAIDAIESDAMLWFCTNSFGLSARVRNAGYFAFLELSVMNFRLGPHFSNAICIARSGLYFRRFDAGCLGCALAGRGRVSGSDRDVGLRMGVVVSGGALASSCHDP